MERLEPKLILVPTDFSDSAAHALRFATALGERFGAHLLVIFADEFIPPVDFTAVPAGSFSVSRDAIIQETAEQLTTWTTKELGPRTLPCQTRLVIDRTVEGIADTVRTTGADLVVMGTHGRAGVRRLLFGSVTEAVMRTVPVPVIAVNRSTSEKGTLGKVLCPVDFTAASRDALRRAAALAGDPQSRLILFTQTPDDDYDTRIETLIRMREWVPPELLTRCDLELVSSGPAAEQILDLAAATHADLIALGIPADRTLADSLRGTVAERVVRQSTCPVLTVNPFAAKMPGGREGERVLVAVPPAAV